MISGIYAIVSPSENFYMGSARDIEKRWREHRSALRKGAHHSAALQRACAKYGVENLRFVIVVGCSEEVLFFYEQMLLDDLKPKYNVNPSACGTRGLRWSETSKMRIRGRTVSAEARAKISSSLRGRKLSPELRAKLSLVHKGVPWTAARAVHKQSAETVAKRAKSITGRAVSLETRKKLAAQAGWKHTEESRLKMSQARVGKIPWNKGISSRRAA